MSYLGRAFWVLFWIPTMFLGRFPAIAGSCWACDYFTGSGSLWGWRNSAWSRLIIMKIQMEQMSWCVITLIGVMGAFYDWPKITLTPFSNNGNGMGPFWLVLRYPTPLSMKWNDRERLWLVKHHLTTVNGIIVLCKTRHNETIMLICHWCGSAQAQTRQP